MKFNNMKSPFLLSLLCFFLLTTKAQLGVGTTVPNSTLDVRGSVSNAYRAFATSTTAATTDNMLVFTGTAVATLTLPNATTCQGRYYWVKNTSSNSSTLTIATTAAQTIDGLATWTLTQTNKTLRLFSNGANWLIATESLPGSTGTPWVHGGNNVTSIQNIGTTSNYSLPFITNNTEKMRLTNTGNLGIGTTTFDATNPEKLLVDAGTTTSYNVISGKGSIDNYLQLNIQNRSAGNSASSDVVATADNGNETVNFIDFGINSSTYNAAAFDVTAANDAYLYSTGNDLAMGNATVNKSFKFFTGGTLAANERMRIDGTGNVGIGTTSIPRGAIGAAKFALHGANGSMSGPHMQFTTSADNYPQIQVLPWMHDNTFMMFDSYWDGASWRSSTAAGGNFMISKSTGIFQMNYANINTQGGAIAGFNYGITLNTAGKVGIGTGVFDATNPEKLLVDAGVTTSVNAIVGKGSINSYLQLNIKNSSAGNAASSDVVATADNGNETTNYIDMGINSSGNTSNVFGGVNDAYLYNVGQNLLIGTSTAAKSVVFLTGGTTQSTNERMRIDGNGSVGIGTPTPGQKLHLNGGNMRITNGGINADIMVGTTFGGITNAAGMVYYEIAGAETHMFGGQVIPDADNNWSCGSAARRWSAIYAANGTIQTSDIRLKKDIHDLPYGLKEVLQLKPVAYKWKDNTGGNKIGLIAQEVRKIVPEVVVGDESKENIGMNYAELVPVLINAIKEQEQNIKSQQQQIDLLKKEVELLKAKK